MARHRRPRRSGPWLSRSLGLLAAVGLGLVWSATGTTQSAWTTGIVTNSTNSGATGSLAFTHSYAATTCTLGARVSGSVSCTGSLAPTAAATAGGVSATDSITNGGTLAASQITSELRATSCAPVKLADSRTAADPMLPRYATSFGQTDPWGSTNAVALSGGSAYAADVAATSTASLLGSNYTVGVWFKVANGYSSGGALVGLASSPVDASSSAGSPLLWMDNSGKIRFSVSGTLGSVSSGVSASAYNDGSWHFAVLSVAAAVFSTPTLYVDNAAGVTSAGITALTYGNAYWHAGWGDFTGVPNAPTSAYLTGSLSGGFTTSSALSSATRTSLDGSATANAYSTAVLALSGIDHLWMFGDSGTTTYAGSLPVIGATSPCTMVDVAWTLAGPAGTVAAAGTKLSALASGTWHTVTAPGSAATQTSTVTASRDATWNAYVAGLRLYTPIEHRLSSGSVWTATLSWTDSSAVFLS
jgi:hypothetical protein